MNLAFWPELPPFSQTGPTCACERAQSCCEPPPLAQVGPSCTCKQAHSAASYPHWPQWGHPAHANKLSPLQAAPDLPGGADLHMQARSSERTD